MLDSPLLAAQKRIAQKSRRVHKNQAVNLQQIPIHGQSGNSFLFCCGADSDESLVATAFAAIGGLSSAAFLPSCFAAEFLHSTAFFFLQKRSATAKAYLLAAVHSPWFKRLR
jgi:hypothetical protein